jgi:hypothetical protein
VNRRCMYTYTAPAYGTAIGSRSHSCLIPYYTFSTLDTPSLPLVTSSDATFHVGKTRYSLTKTKLNSVAFSPQANYTDRATAVCRRS